MSLLLNRWNNEIKKKINSTNKNEVGPQRPDTNNSTSTNKIVTIYNPATTSNTSGGSSSGGSSGGGSNKNSQYTGYTIGSDYGKQVAQNMGIGESFSATDGSVWTKEKDGTITVRKNGQTYTNVYKQSDLGTLGRQQVAAGVPYEYVEQTLYDRLDKIANNPELSQYANDGTYLMLYNYIQDQKNAEEKAKYEEVEQDRPDEYENPYKAEIDYLLNQILNRDDFSYNAMNDPLYQQYADMYRREGDRAMKETLAEAAAGAGGMNTYAITAAQQANSYYNSQLNDRIPELYQLAYNMYLNDKESKVQDLGILQDMDATQYNRYRDTIQDYYADKNFAYGAYQDAVQQGNWNTNLNYNSLLDNRNFNNDEYWKNKEWNYNDMWANKEWNTNQADKEYERDLYAQEKAYAQIMDWIEKGVTSFSDEELAKAGIDRTKVNQMIADHQAQQAKVGTSSIGGSSKSGSGYTGGSKKTTSGSDSGNGYSGGNGNGDEVSAASSSSITNLGIGPVSNDLLEQLAKAGAIEGDTKGNLYWADGWNSTNYRERLNALKGYGNLLTLPGF
ncbi:MAG: hypothetical protein IJN43_07745 [Ruminococcus sp.]|nr:hypothetical protein [Ruminococcus sp.]